MTIVSNNINRFPVLQFLLILSYHSLGVAYSNRITIDPAASIYLADEVDNSVGIFSYGGNLAFEYDIGNKFNLVNAFSVGLPILLGTSDEITNQHYLLTTYIMVKYYPTAEAQTKLLEGSEKQILIEDRKRGILPYVGAGGTYSFFVNDSGNTDFVNLSLAGVAFTTGFDIPMNPTWGFNFFSQISTNATVIPPLLIFLQFHTGFGAYFNF